MIPTRHIPSLLMGSSLLLFLAGCQSAPPPAPRTMAQLEGQTMIQPPRLQPGDTIMFVAPAKRLNEGRMMVAKFQLESLGYKVKMRKDLFADDGYLAGSDKRRAKELMQAFLDPQVDAIFPGTGGYGTMRIFDQLDFEKIRAHPKIVIGFSDITGLHAALNRHSGLVTFHTPNPMWGLGSDEGMTPFTEEYFWKALLASGEVQQNGYTIEIPEDAPQPTAMGKGKARGRLTGGNLTVIAALEGTPFAIDTRDAILVIEDVNEAPYRVDRMLRQLQLAGELDALRGAVLGQFTRNYDREEDQTEDPRYTIDTVLKEYFEPLRIPVLANFPLGHHRYNASLPLGAQVEVDADKGVLRVLPYSR